MHLLKTEQLYIWPERTVGVYGSASINIDEFLFLNGTLRAESASTFGDGNKTFYFPSASVAWQFSKLNLFDDTVLSFGKLRASYGEVGVQPSRYQTSNFLTPISAIIWEVHSLAIYTMVVLFLRDLEEVVV